jgi:hypothetical protein
MAWLTVIEYQCHKWSWIGSVCYNRNLNLSSCMTYHQVGNKSNMTGATSGARTAYPSRAPEFTLGFKWGSQELFTLPEHPSSPLVLSGVHRNCLPFQSTWVHPLFIVGFTWTAYPSRAAKFTLGFKWGSQELFTLPEHLSSPLVYSVVYVVQSLVFCVVFCRSLLVLLSFFFTMVLSVLWSTAIDYPFSIFKLLVIDCIVCPLIYDFWLPFSIFKLLAIALSVLWFTTSDYPFVIFKLLTMLLAVLWLTASEYHFGSRRNEQSL